MNITRICSRLVLVLLAVAVTSSAAHGQFLLNCCMSDGSCQSFFGESCAQIGGVQTDQFCSNCGCAGNCGGQAANCWCDNACHTAGDCCNDVCQHCTAPQVPNCSCQGNCGGNSGPLPRCWCDSVCINAGDCCLDFCDHCPHINPPGCAATLEYNFCEDAQPVSDGSHSTNSNFYTASGVASSCSGAGAKDRWFAYTASCTGIATASTCGEFSTGNVAISVFTACPSQGGTEIACNDVNPDCQPSKSNPEDHAAVSWPSEQGTTYLVRVSATSEFNTAFFNPVLLECESCDAWDDLDGGTDGSVFALTAHNGDLIAGGGFTMASGQEAGRIARWDGTSWHPISQVNGTVWALTVYQGDLIVGGSFFTTGSGQSMNFIARWDGSSWHQLSSGGQTGVNSHVFALAEYNGDLIAGGDFTTAGGQTVNRIARWDGSAWHPFISDGQTGVNGRVNAITVYNGDLIAGGLLSTAGGQVMNRIARWDGTTWHPFISGGQVGVDDGSAAIPFVVALTEYNGNLFVGGDFTTAGGQTVNNIARWDGSWWHPLMSGGQIGTDARVRGALTEYNGHLIVGGEFTTAGGQTMNHIARWNGSSWQPFVSGGQTGTDDTIRALREHNGHLIAGGQFNTARGQTVNHIALWRDCVPPLTCGDPDAGDCFTANGSTSCDDADCCGAVCAQDPFCCGASGGTWDDVCVMQAEIICLGLPVGECGSKLSGACFNPNPTPGCKLEACCDAVCAEDGFCCKTEWDSECVALAEDICTQPGFGNSGGQTGTFSPAGAHGLFTYEVKYFNGSLLEGELCCGLNELPQEVTANFVLDIYDGIGTSPGFTAGIENVVSFSLKFGNNHWTDLLLFDMTLDIIGPNMATELTWVGTRLIDGDSTEIPLNFPLTFKGTDASGKPFEILHTDSICELVPTSCDEIGCCEGHCGGMSPLGCACDADCVNRGDCCSDFGTTCATCPADLTGDGIVNVFDLLEILAAWGPCPAPCPADLDNNGIVNVFDLLELLAQWGLCL